MGRKALLPPRWKIFWHWIYPFQAISSNFGLCGRKAPPPKMRGNFLTLDLSISGNFEQLWFCGRKAPADEGKFFYTGYIHFRKFRAALFFVAEKDPPPPPPPDEGKSFDIGSIHFRQFWATLVFVAEKPSPSPHPQDEGKFFDTGSINFRQFRASLIFVGEKPPCRWGKIYWHWIYPFQAISSNFGFCGRKAPPLRWGKIFWHWIYPFQAISSNFGFCGRKDPPSFLPFDERPDSCHTCGIPIMVPILQIHTQIPPIRISSVGYQLCLLFKYSHILKYRTQDCGTGGRPIGSLTTIHTNIPAIIITVLAMALWNVIRLLYVHAYISLSGYMTKLLVILLQQLMSI